VRPILAEWRKRKGIEPDPLRAYRASGYEAKVAKERESARAARGSAGSGSYA
jgi:L-rhamnose isomerase/sugar isomerase